MEPTPKRRIPRTVMIAVPTVFLGLVVFLVSMAYRSNKASRAVGATPSAIASTASTDAFLGCTSCHGSVDKVFAEGKVPYLKYTHKMHFSKGVSDCSVCHPPDTHTADHISKPTMSRCFTCHGTTKAAIVRSTCNTCHPPNIPKKPPTHLTSTWLPGGHAKAALEDQFACLTCHEQKFCQSCHGLTMPHADGWAQKPHAQAFFDSPGVCLQCHARTPQTHDFCDTCHHPKGPEDQSWRQYHPNVVKTSGAQTCFQCHSDQTCRTCHATGREDFSADRALLIASSVPPPTATPTATSSG